MFETVPLSFYPKTLNDWSYRDQKLWYSGNLELLKLNMISVIGSRNVSDFGANRAYRITRLLVEHGYCVVSGLAEGIDSIAHKTALDCGGKTIAVMGTPIDNCYPAKNKDLKSEIEHKGLVLSQFEPGERVFQGNFPKRNTLMAALSEISIVIEASEKSGTRHQVSSAIKMGRRVGFLASVAEQKFSWILDALSSGKAFVIKEPEDLIRELKYRKTNILNQESENRLRIWDFTEQQLSLNLDESNPKSEKKSPKKKSNNRKA